MKLMIPLIAGIIVLSMPAIAIPGTAREEASSLVAALDKVYGADVDTEALKSAVSEAVEAGIPSELMETLVRESASKGRSPKEVSGYIEIASDLHSNGIPSELIFNTVLEGFVKEVDKETMENTIGMLRSKLLFCNETAQRHTGRRGGKQSRHELLLTALFYTMNTGFNKSQITTLSKAEADEKLGSLHFFNILKISMELQNLGLDNGSITVLIERSIRQRVSIHQMSQYPSIVREGKVQGLSDEQIYSSIFNQTDKAFPPERSDSKKSTAAEMSAPQPEGGGGGREGGLPPGGSPGGRK
ncbi:MAG: hypothetical protein JSV25_10300 [Spirochaetota bacterium]|nr:MAG: hypothetical protein JSV25_10300 [Spirochaetota bacterium]